MLAPRFRAMRAITLAKQHLGDSPETQPSAQLCLDDACACLRQGAFDECITRACKSLAYSVGDSHPDYTKAAQSH